MKRKLEIILHAYAYVLVNAFGFLCKKNKRVWVFGEMAGHSFIHNSRFLFEYVNREHKDITAIWITKDRTIVRDIRDRGYKAFGFYSLIGVYYKSIAKIYLVSHGSLIDVGGGYAKNAFIINLWHGMPIKGLGDGRTKPKKKLTSRLSSYFQNGHAKLDLVCTTSDFFTTIFESIFEDAKSIQALGQTTDAYVHLNLDKVDFLEKVGVNNCGGEKVITYLPTFRDGESCQHLPLLNDNNSIPNNLIFLYKLHPKVSLEGVKCNHKNIHFLPSNTSTYDLLSVTDILITDYSSIYIDFLLKDKPIIFYVYDYKQYSKDRGFLFDFDSYTPGEKIVEESKLLSSVEKCIVEDAYAVEREKMRAVFFKFDDGKSCARIVAEIWKMIDECD